jgi:hypothetical protein
MKKNILNDSEFKTKIVEIYREEQIKLLEEKWNMLSYQDKKFVFEFLKVLYPDKASLLNEKWYNTVLDVAGIFDPTGAIDLTNGILYWRQGDHLFALLSWISVIPYIGDLAAKPVVGVLKAGGVVGKEFKIAMAAKDAAKIASTAKKSGPFRTFVERAPIWGGELITMLKKFVNKFPFIKKIIPIIEDYVKLFKTASVEMKTASTASKGAEAVFKGFRNFKGVKNNWFKYMTSNAPLWEKLNAGSFRIFGGNPATRSLMRRSKWYLGFLDTVGLANTVGPEEIESKVPDFEAKLDEYNKSDIAQKNMMEDISNSNSDANMSAAPPPPPPQQQQTGDFDIMKMLFGI